MVNRSRGRHPVVVVNITSTDEDVVQWVAAKFGMVRPYGPYPPETRRDRRTGICLSKKPYWQATVTGARAIGVMMTIYPLLHVRRRARIRQLIAEWRSHPIDNGNREQIRRLFPQPTQ